MNKRVKKLIPGLIVVATTIAYTASAASAGLLGNI